MAQVPALETIGTSKAPASSTYHGVTVTEHYRWLEDAASDRTRSWTMAQDRRTRSYLENLPCYGAVRRRAGEVLTAESDTYAALQRAGSAYFALKHQPPRQQPFLVMLGDLDELSDERVLVDPNRIETAALPRLTGTSRLPMAASSRCPCPRVAPRTAPCTFIRPRLVG